MPERTVIVVGGPTASGKSALALDLAEEFGGTVINADSMQIYRELPVLTARPTAADEALAPHRLYGVLPSSKRCSAADDDDCSFGHGQGLVGHFIKAADLRRGYSK
jgi:tRNA dimethylallyltransferase